MSESQRLQTTSSNASGSVEPARTAIFAVLAAVSVLLAVVTRPTGPKEGAEFADVGEMFYPDFMDADKAKSLEVVSYNKEIGSIRRFAVAQDKDGRWRIPSALNYPADGKDQLAKTATSVIGIKREAFAGRRESQHAEFGVLDPNAEVTTDFNGVGNRITLKDGEGKVLADYIIGKEVKGQTGFHYIRRPDQKATYRTKINIQVTTKFVDWIESDLLKLDGSRLSSIKIDTTSVVEGEQRQLVEGEITQLSRKISSDPWKIDGLDDAKEEVNQDEVRKITDALDNLKIVGVRKKPQMLIQSLKEGDFQLNQLTMMDLDSKGFMLGRSPGSKGLRMIAKNGSLLATTDQGVRYDLKFGEIFSGTDEEIEVGFGVNDDGTEKTKSEEKKPDGDGDKPMKKSRYLLLMVNFDASALGPKPVAPEKPEPPEAKEEAKSDDKPTDDAGKEEAAKAKEEANKAYEAAKAKFSIDQAKYESDLKVYKDKVKDGEKLVKSLNQRFADWYYVVSGDSFENLRQGRKTLVKEKASEQPKTDEAKGDSNFDGVTKPETKKEDADSPDALKSDKPKEDAPKEEGKPEQKSDEGKSDAPKTEEPKGTPEKSE